MREGDDGAPPQRTHDRVSTKKLLAVPHLETLLHLIRHRTTALPRVGSAEA